MKKTKQYSNANIIKMSLVLIAFFMAIITINHYSKFEFSTYKSIIITKTVEVEQEEVWHTAEMSMYNAGDITQCSGDPCISASGDNICDMLREGYSICAANFLPLGTEIHIAGGLGRCLILDRMSKKHPDRIDWALPFDGEYGEWKEHALDFGVRSVSFTIEGHYEKDADGDYFQEYYFQPITN